MLAGLWRRLQARREATAVQRRAIPDDLWKRTLVRFPFLRRRDGGDAAELRRLTSLFLDKKEFSAAGGLKLTDQMVVAIAAQAVLPVLRLGLARYDSFVGIVVQPGEVLARRSVAGEDGVVHEYDDVLAGEAVQGGPVMLSWPDVRAAGRSPTAAAYNVVIHEFAHVLDMDSGLSARLPALRHEYAAFVRRVDAGEATALDPYGAEAEEEFFAVASEAFFVTPAAMKAEHPVLYGVFCGLYHQDPTEDTAPLRR